MARREPEVLRQAAELEEQAAKRFARWDARTWREIVDGPAAALARKAPAAVVDSYLSLACEGVGLGYLFPASAGENVFGLAWRRLLPERLPALPPARQAEVLASMWNLGENLEQSPAWLRRIFLRLLRDLKDLDAIDAVVEEIARRAFEAPTKPLEGAGRPVWVSLAGEDRRFLPGRLHFVAPLVVCVHDRHRGAATTGVWLVEPALALGPMGCGAEVPDVAAGGFWKTLVKADPRITVLHSAVSNDWRAAGTLVTSQYLVAVLP